MSQSRAKNKPLVVLDFTCDHCGKTLDAIVLAKAGTQNKLVSTLHKECWSQQIQPHVQFRGAN